MPAKRIEGRHPLRARQPDRRPSRGDLRGRRARRPGAGAPGVGQDLPAGSGLLRGAFPRRAQPDEGGPGRPGQDRRGPRAPPAAARLGGGEGEDPPRGNRGRAAGSAGSNRAPALAWGADRGRAPDALFPLVVVGGSIPNRIVMPPMTTRLAEPQIRGPGGPGDLGSPNSPAYEGPHDSYVAAPRALRDGRAALPPAFVVACRPGCPRHSDEARSRCARSARRCSPPGGWPGRRWSASGWPQRPW
jgi:hypothetical protein